MSEIEITVEDFGGHSGKNTHKISKGKLNIIGGSSASGKSSLVRGAQFALVGGATKHGPLADEINNLHLDDGSSEGYGLVHSGKNKATAEIVSDGIGFSSTISKSGMVSGVNNNMKAAYTTMLSSQPESILHEAVMKETNGDDFSWVVDDLSEANNYLNWSNILHRVKQEINSKKKEFETWKSSSKNIDSKIEQLTEKRKKVSEKRSTVIAEMKDGREGIDKEIDAATKLKETAERNVEKLESELRVMENNTSLFEDRLKKARENQRIYRRQIDAIEEAVEQGYQTPDTSVLDTAIESLKLELAAASGKDGSVWRISEAIDAIAKQPSPVTELTNLRKFWIDELGDNEKLKAIQAELSEKQRERTSILTKAAQRRQEIASAKQRMADLKRQENDAKKQQSEAQQAMPFAEAKLRETREKLATDKLALASAEQRVRVLNDELSQYDNPEKEALDAQYKILDDEIKSLMLSKQKSFLIRYDSLGMMGSDTIEVNEELGSAHFSGIDRSDKSEQELLEKNLSKSSSEIEGLLLGLLKQGKLSEIVNATFDYAEQKAKEHREKAREIFNQVGATIFTTLSFSPMQKMELDSSYQLRISWKDGRVTGLSGSGGERTIVAAAMLIAMRRAYTPEIPMLFFDGVMGNLNDKARKELESFLASYAESTDIAVVATLLTDSPQLKIETR